MIFISLCILLFPVVFGVDFTCYPSPHQLPEQEHCFELTDIIRRYSYLPFQDREKEWGRDLTTTDTTEKLPKVYWVDAPETRTCAIHLDIKEQYSAAVEHFKLRTVAATADVVIIRCLVGRNLIGTIPMGNRRLVEGQVARLDHPFRDGGVKVADLGNGTSLWSADLGSDSGRNISLASAAETALLDAS